MILRNTIKWELRKYYYRAGLPLVYLVIAWVILLIMPVSRDDWNALIDSILIMLLTTMALWAMAVGLYMILFHPFSTAFCDLHKATLIEHQTSRPYAYKLYVRIVLNIITFFAGVGVLWVTLRILQRFETWVDRAWFSNMLADSPVVMLPLVFMFAVGAPLMLLFGWRYFDLVLSKRHNDIDGLDITAMLAAGALTGLFAFMERIFQWMPFPAAVVIVTIVYIVITIVAVLLISRFIDRFAEVSV